MDFYALAFAFPVVTELWAPLPLTSVAIREAVQYDGEMLEYHFYLCAVEAVPVHSR